MRSAPATRAGEAPGRLPAVGALIVVGNGRYSTLLARTLDPGSHVRVDAKDGELILQAEPRPQ
jgi:hypothetical protein